MQLIGKIFHRNFSGLALIIVWILFHTNCCSAFTIYWPRKIHFTKSDMNCATAVQRQNCVSVYLLLVSSMSADKSISNLRWHNETKMDIWNVINVPFRVLCGWFSVVVFVVVLCMLLTWCAYIQVLCMCVRMKVKNEMENRLRFSTRLNCWNNNKTNAQKCLFN